MASEQDIDALALKVAQRNVDLHASIERLVGLIAAAQRIVAFTGAGISTESGIPDFRSPGGVWTKLNPADYTFQKFVTDLETRKRSWERFKNGVYEAKPNPAHLAIAELEKLGKLDCVITQNVDGLHQEGGTSPEKVIELHGSSRYVKCLECEKRFTRDEVLVMLYNGVESPTCDECEGLLKTATISFGQAMPPGAVAAATSHSRNCDLMIVVGSTLVVYPAAFMPSYALEAGSRLAIINLSETSLDGQAEVRIWAKAGEVLPEVVDRLRARLGGESTPPFLNSPQH